MIRVIFLLISCTRFSESATFFVKSNGEDNPFNFKFTKLLDFNIESKAESWKNDLGKFLKTQIDEDDTGRKDEFLHIPMQISFDIDKNEIQRNYDSTFDVLQVCKTMIGTSRHPLCGFDTDNKKPKKIHPRSCREILETGNNKTGIYKIQPVLSSKPFAVLCDMETKGGGWTQIQKRFDGSQDFYLQWRDYKFGFGDLNGEFWIGLEHIHLMTGIETNELLVELTDMDKKIAYAQYGTFAVGPEKDGYPLETLSRFSGDAGDSLTEHLNAKFTTRDLDQDTHQDNCATKFEGAWWYKGADCHASHLNGKFLNMLPKGYEFHGLSWDTLHGYKYILAGSRMLVRPIGA